ncbi:RNI-like protein [Rhizopus microsporus var. microsporus]|uniref:RNI-like protein n=1 Tax=Rhizopus microsporus var. microsporus TaxID=86635 RepID=A0A1X0RGA8_RHIZD|nr:RNI-like protein [Rhizopus microsporus var. microsporus]
MEHLSIELVELIAKQCRASNKDLASLCLVNRHFYSAVIRLLYKNVIIHGPRQYLAFKSTCTRLKQMVYRLDFSGYTTRGARWTESKAKSVVTAEDLAVILNECRQLKELFVGEELMHVFVSPLAIQSVFFEQQLRTLDFTGFSDQTFTKAMADYFMEKKQLENISFYMCMALSQDRFFVPFFDKLKSGGHQLKKLDLAYTQINSQLFRHLPSPRTLTHLNLQGCHSLSCCSELIDYLMQCKRLVQLNVNRHIASGFCKRCIYQLLTSIDTLEIVDIGGHVEFDDELIQQLPPNRNIKYLSVANCRQIDIKTLLNKFPQLYYLNVERVINMNQLYNFLKSNNNNLRIIEVSSHPSLLNQIGSWHLVKHGRRAYYSQSAVDPKYCYSKKIVMSKDPILSPMNRYWCYSYNIST